MILNSGLTGSQFVSCFSTGRIGGSGFVLRTGCSPSLTLPVSAPVPSSTASPRQRRHWTRLPLFRTPPLALLHRGCRLFFRNWLLPGYNRCRIPRNMPHLLSRVTVLDQGFMNPGEQLRLRKVLEGPRMRGCIRHITRPRPATHRPKQDIGKKALSYPASRRNV